MSISYAKPYLKGGITYTELGFDVVSAKPDTLVLLAPITPDQPHTTQIYLQFINANAFLLSRSDEPLTSSGMVVRCPSTSH